ncbi:hypothetical protein SUGI_0681920 [Cryptomeria japonica]|nr:hypothetical protein SUGI_0681920 [Cryptomeria japonica]
MDGLNSRGQVVLIGATNKIDFIDGALHRPEAPINAFREKYRQVYTSDDKFVVDLDSMKVEKHGLLEAMSISLDPLTQATAGMARTIETKSGLSKRVPIGLTRMVLYENADKKDEIIFVLLLIILHFLIVLSSIVFRY